MSLRRIALAIALAATLTACGRGPGLLAPVPAALGMKAQALEVPDELLLLPRFTRTGGGRLGDPVNIVIAGDDAQIVEGFDKLDWDPADPVTWRTALKMVKAGILRHAYPTSPISPLYMFGRAQDLAYQKNAKSVFARDHLRVWRSPQLDAAGRAYWVISATEDVAVSWSGNHPTHRIDPKIDEERDLVVKEWESTGMVAKKTSFQALEPGFKGLNGEGDPYETDGRVFFLELAPKAPGVPAPLPSPSVAPGG